MTAYAKNTIHSESTKPSIRNPPEYMTAAISRHPLMPIRETRPFTARPATPDTTRYTENPKLTTEASAPSISVMGMRSMLNEYSPNP